MNHDIAIKKYTSFESERQRITKLIDTTDFKLKFSNISIPQKILINNIEIPFQIIGFYIPDVKVWLWSWSHILVRDIDILPSYNIFKYGLKLKDKNDKIKYVSSRLEIKNETEIDTFLSLSCHLEDNPYIFKIPSDKHGMIYIQLDLEELENYKYFK